jgi:hypothetical protein
MLPYLPKPHPKAVSVAKCSHNPKCYWPIINDFHLQSFLMMCLAWKHDVTDATKEPLYFHSNCVSVAWSPYMTFNFLADFKCWHTSPSPVLMLPLSQSILVTLGKVKILKLSSYFLSYALQVLPSDYPDLTTILQLRGLILLKALINYV